MFAYSDAIEREMYEGLGEADAQLWLDRSASQGYAPAMNAKKGKTVRAAIGLLGALAAAGGSNSDDEGDAPRRACNCTTGFVTEKPCSCRGFNMYPSELGPMDTCADCNHKKHDHNW